MLDSLVKEILEVDQLVLREKGKKNKFLIKKVASELRQKLATLMKSDHEIVNELHLFRQHHKWGDTVALYSKESWEKVKNYLDKRKDGTISNNSTI